MKKPRPESPGKNDCWQCHDQSRGGAFVRAVYPELLKVAKEKGTIKPTVSLQEKK